MPRYKGEWVHRVHFNQFPERKKDPGQPQFGGCSQKIPKIYTPREITPKEKAHHERMRRLYPDYDEWPEEKKMEWLVHVI
jgi:hypothetical protein